MDYRELEPPDPDAGRLTIIGCIPDDPQVRRKISKMMGVECVPYPDSIEGTCQTCGQKVWIGPRQQKIKNAHVLCLICAAQAKILTDAEVQSLSNKKWGEAEPDPIT